jgi:hypothetical protein
MQRSIKLLDNVSVYIIAYVTFLRAINFRSDNNSNFDAAITLGCDSSSDKLEVRRAPIN